MHPYSDEVSFGAETFEGYMTQFMYSEVRFKDFRKAIIPKFDSSRNDSFIHWYKLFCSICLQWGIWCPPMNLPKKTPSTVLGGPSCRSLFAIAIPS